MADLEITNTKLLNTKHTNICYKTMFSPNNSTHLYTTGFDYKLCQWNLNDAKKSQSTSISNLLVNEIGQEAMSYNPPFCYAWDTFE